MKPSSNIKVTDQKDLKDRYGLLAKGILPANEITEVFLASNFTDYVNLFFNITNDSLSSSKVSIWVTNKYTPEREDLLESNIPLDAMLTYVRGPVLISTKERIFMRADTDSVIYRLTGYDERKL